MKTNQVSRVDWGRRLGRWAGGLAVGGWLAASGADTPWEAMDYGPFLTASIEVPGARTNIAYKGIAVRLGEGAVVFDTDLLRYAAGWTGGYVALKGVVFDGEHWAFPRIEGTEVFSNPARPGWDRDGAFDDPRDEPYGPLPRDWAHWKGLYRHGDRVVLSYSVGGMAVLETPGMEASPAGPVWTRTFNLGATASRHAVQIAQASGGGPATVLRLSDLGPADPGSPAGQTLVVVPLEVSGVDPLRRDPGTEVLAVGCVGETVTEPWGLTVDGDVRWRIPAGQPVSRHKVLIWRGQRAGLAGFAAVVRGAAPPEDLGPLTRGGPRRWTQTLETRGRSGSGPGPYVIDELTAPDDNPWRSWMRFGALDFFADARRAAVTTWNGDVWVVTGVEGALERLAWQRVATGLFQPLGLKIVEDSLYVLGRDQITRLRDLNGDGEADFYENFNNDARVSEHFHEFATDLKLGPDGDFYYVKCARHALPASHSQHGSLLRVSRDGTRTEVVARGFRAVNGLGVGPHGDVTTIDNQGHWMPANRLNWVRPGGWYGNQWAWNPEGRTAYDPPLCWMHNDVDRSGGTQLWVPTDGWGPLRGGLITVSYGMGQVFLVLKDPASEVAQGAVTRLPLDFETGVMRGAFHPDNHQLYLCGLYGWAGNKTRPGGLYRVRYTGRPLLLPNRLQIAGDGIVLGFTEPLDPATALDPGNYDLSAWNYRWSAQYGSPDLRMNGQEGRDSWSLGSIALAADRRSVFLGIPDLQPVMQWHLKFRLSGADGQPVENFIHGTIHRLGTEPGLGALGAGATVQTVAGGPPVADARGGLRQTVESRVAGGGTDVRVTRLAALQVPRGAPPTALVAPGPFRVRWDGWLRHDVNDAVEFEFAGRGRAALHLNGFLVHEEDGDLGRRRSAVVTVRGGFNAVSVEYESPAEGDAEFRWLWMSARAPREPVPATALVHDPADPALLRHSMLREGRAIVAERRCHACHAWGTDVSDTASMPELAADAPAFTGLGDRLREAWVAEWLLDPRRFRPDARMPRLLRGEDAANDARDLAAYLATLRERPEGVDTPRGDREAGRQAFATLGCRACHRLPEEPALIGDDDRLTLGHLGAKWRPAALAAFLRQPSARHRWTRMPDFHLSPEEAANLTEFLMPLVGGGEPEAGPVRDAGDPVRGRALVQTLGCQRCHDGGDGRGTPVAEAPRSKVAWGDGTRGCLAVEASGRGAAPDFGWSAGEHAALMALRGREVAALVGRDTAEEFAERQYRRLQCHACHGRDGEADRLSEIDMAAGGTAGEDDEEEGGGSVHLGRPVLTHAGGKLYSDWVRRFLEGTLPYKPRPQVQGRMPAFPAYAAGLAEGMAQQHGHRAEAAPRERGDAQRVELGRRLTGVDGGFSCVACHGVGEVPALAGSDTATVNFAAVGDRLRRDYYWRYVQDPTRLVPGTMMPKFIGEDGRTAIRSVLDGDPARQFDAIWQYLHSLRGTWTPDADPRR